MKQRTKNVLILVSLLLIVTAFISGVVAYLTSADGDVNTLTVGQVDITLDEAKVNTDGTVVEGAERVHNNTYHLLPGHAYVKDPTVTVKSGSEESYIRVFLTFNNASKLKKIFPDPISLLDGYDAAIWIYETEYIDKATDTITYEFRYFEKTEAVHKDMELTPVFEKLVIPGAVNSEDLKNISNLTIVAEAHAIQSAGFENSDDAWIAFESQINK